jgi:hypothetical protein
MIKARAGNVVFLGLEARNIELLQAGRPMAMELKELGLPDVAIVIVYGETKEEIIATLERDTGLKMPQIHPEHDKPM